MHHNDKSKRWNYLLLGCLANLCFLGAANLLHSVLAFLALFTRWFLDFHESVTTESVLWLELLGKVKRVVDERESGRFATAKVGAEAEDEANVWCHLVHCCELVANIFL